MSAMGRRELGDCGRIVVKLGTNVVTHDGVRLALGRIFGIVEDLAALHTAGRQVLLVSSGAVGMGMRSLHLDERPTSLGARQACAAVGQGHLIALYTQAFTELGVTAAQVLLTREDLADRDRALCVRTTLTRLLEFGVLPILNENDSVSVRELLEDTDRAFGDNDGLSARVAISLSAGALIVLTDVDGVYTDNPVTHSDATRIPHLAADETLAFAGSQSTSPAGTGGMMSKLAAARLAAEAGTTVIIASGSTPGVVTRLIAGEDLGTIIAATTRRNAHQRHIAVTAEQHGALVINAGALQAIGERKASLLPIGVVRVEGIFDRGDVVEIRDAGGRVHGRGLANYASDDCKRLAGHHSAEIEGIIGWRGYDALVTRTNMVLARV